jgi:CheY-like chemotaxis protein
MPSKIRRKQKIELFYSYSHKDERLREKLENHLGVLEKVGVITNWHFRKITAGKDWEGEIDSHLNSADIILLLISPNYLASKYCSDIEMRRAIERHELGEARVVPIILSDVKSWESTPFAKFQALPEHAKPILKWRNRDDAFKNIAEGIAQVVNELKKGRKVPKIIIIEDDLKWLKRIRNVLKAKNFEVEAYNKYGEELLHILAKKDYDLLITDLILDSLAFTKEGKTVVEFARGLNKNTPIIVISGYADVYDVREAFFKLKIDDFILKSTWDPANFLEAVINALNKNRSSS